MPAKRKRDILDGFDPNKSDSEDENFDPSEDRPRRSAKKSRAPRPKTPGAASRSKRVKYRGSDIEDDELSESELEDSFGENEEEEDDEDEDLPLNATGRRMRHAAVKHQSYKESSDDESAVLDSDDTVIKKASKRPSLLVTLKAPNSMRTSGRPKRGVKDEAAQQMPPPTRRSTRARTEETEEPLLELSNSGRHVQTVRASKSRSPEAMSRATRTTRAGKGLKKLPEPIEEATQESDPKEEAMDSRDDDVDELVGSGEENNLEKADQQDEEDAASHQEDEATYENQEEGDAAKIEEAAPGEGDDDDDSDRPLTRRTRAARAAATTPAAAEDADADGEGEGEGEVEKAAEPRRGTRTSRLRSKKSMQEPSSDFEPGEESGEAEASASEAVGKAKSKSNRRSVNASEDDSTTPVPTRGRGARSQTRGTKRTRRSQADSGDEEVELDKDEMAEELEELRQSSRSRPRRTRHRSPSIQYEERASKKRRTKPVDYSIPAIDYAALEAEEEEPAQTPARTRKGGKNGGNQSWERTINNTYGPFGGGGGAGSLLAGPWGTGATGGVDSDSSDDEMVQRSGLGGAVGMTPTSAAAPGGGLFGAAAQSHGTDGPLAVGGATPNVGKVKNTKALADADPLGVDLNVDFSKVGGLQGHIDQLKEMVQLPLLYPELFLKFHVTPPRGVLFHGPPGTGKTLLARALANSVGSGGRKISFYMRKGADALSKWVGEAEKQLRLLFEEARRTQPSIIFFDEIDGLAPVRSSKQEQIHASIVSTLLALMDGMDGRGQVIVIGATNRPDNIDPALRRPGRFDREFYFPLPDVEGRRSIIDIHTKDWGISGGFKNALAENTKGYGGADLRALCTEAALNAIQRTYPQIYSSQEKLVVDPEKITIHATDFMLSVKKMIPSSERSASSSATPLPRSVEPLLRTQYQSIIKVLENIMPRPKKMTALDEAMYEPFEDADHGFGREAMHQEFERSRIFRPRLLICGVPGMGQNYLAGAVLHHMEGVHVQTMDLATLLGDGRPLEQVIVSLFTEVKRHRPSIIYVPNIDVWWTSIGEAAITTFTTMMRSIPPADPVLLMATSEVAPASIAPDILKELFGFSKRNRVIVDRPGRENRLEFFENIIVHLRKSPTEFPDPSDRKKRVLEVLPVAPPPPPRTLTKEEIKAQRKTDLHHLNLLKMRLQPIMDQINRKYRKFRTPLVSQGSLQYLIDEAQPNFVRADVPDNMPRPYALTHDKDGVQCFTEIATGKLFYNLETSTIEERLANGYYARPVDFYKDINKLYIDAKTFGDRERTLKANELRTNVEVDVHDISQTLANQGIRFEEIYQRQVQRTKEAEERARKKKALQEVVDLVQSDVGGDGDADSDSAGPVGVAVLDTATTGARFVPMMSPPPNGHVGSSESRPLTNGTPAPSRPDGDDVEMGGLDDTQPHSGHNADLNGPYRWRLEPRPLGDSTVATAGTQISQRSALTAVPAGVSPSAILNDASTTKTSDPSTNRSNNWSTQNTNGVAGNPDSQLVDTQDQGFSGPSQATSSGRDWAHSQAAAIVRGILPPRPEMHQQFSGGLIEENSPTSSQAVAGKSANIASLNNILNDDSANTTTTSSSSLRNTASSGSSQQPVMHEGKINEFLATLADRTSGCSVEQLEQINRELMDEIWKTRNEWNRMTVLSTLTSVFNDTISDIELVQGMLDNNSQLPQDEQDQQQPGPSQQQDSMLDSSESSLEPFVHLT
ncbi:hypothetical protein B0T24DRAFT_186447 [Lasiosphaeria ovina]|uniref:AAA+ ATPase domain-containing protein n=1 Tax=Lasiosphaeria ovina TaxID=92902 RepID=A0AAE0NEZ3_9PEZI|nr:hypothetical protein B0T24DRAFT_186447 [Lasiosphaeria ovina]